MRHLLGLPVGSILSTGIAVDSALEVHVGGQQRYQGTAGRVGQKLAVRLHQSPDSSSSTSPSHS